MTTRRLPATFSRSGLSFMRTADSRMRLARRDEAAADVAVLHEPWPYGMPLTRAKPSAAGTPDSGTPMTMSASTGACIGELLAHAHAGLVDVVPVQDAVGPSEVDELEQAERRGDDRSRGNGRSERQPVASMTTISPGSSSRTKWAPTMSSAGVSDASTQPLLELAEAQRPEPVRDHARR